jgi:hypothetical protein
MTLTEIPNFNSIAKRFQESNRNADIAFEEKEFHKVTIYETSMDEIITILLTIMGLCTFGGSRQWLKKELMKIN